VENKPVSDKDEASLMFTVASIAIIATMVLALARAIAGPTVFDRILAVNTFSTETVLLIAVLGFLTRRPAFLDLALLYALLNFIGSVAVLKFIRYGNWDRSELELENP
jgi:multicomponent Na+:H+ antiporter subunit F